MNSGRNLVSRPIIADKKPIKVDLEKGETYAWCRCGRSRNQPFCDGSHKGTSITPLEFMADKIPWVDTVWDLVHTFIRPIGGAVIAVAALGEASPTLEGLIALIGGTVAASTHLTKTGTRVAINASPEPVSNWMVSFAEDAFVVALGYFALAHPVATLLIVVVLLALIVSFFGVTMRLAWRRLFGRSAAVQKTATRTG